MKLNPRFVFTLIVLLALFVLPVAAQEGAPTELPGSAQETILLLPALSILVAGFFANRVTKWITVYCTFLNKEDRGKAAKIITEFLAAVVSLGFGLLATQLVPIAEWLDVNNVWPIVAAVWPVAWGFFALDSVRKRLPFLNGQSAA